MAKPGEIVTPVGIELNEKGMAAGLKALQSQIDTIIKKLNDAGTAASKAVGKAGKAGTDAMGGVSQQARILSQLQSSIKTLMSTNANTMFGSTAQFERIGKMASGINALTANMESGSKASDKLAARIRGINVEAGRMIANKQALPANFWDRKLQLEGAVNASKAIEANYARMLQNIGKLSNDSQGKLGPLLTQLNEKRNAFSTMSGDNRTGPQLLLNLRTQESISKEIEKQIRLLATQEKNESGLLRATQLRAQALLSLSATEREAQLRNGANRYSMLLNGRNGGGQFNQVGDMRLDPVMRMRENGMRTLERATAAAAATQVKLNQALASNVGAERVQQLIDRYQMLMRVQQQSLAVAERQNKPSFIGGIKEGFAGVAGASGGGLAGIGNLVGRVGAFTAAYQGIQLVTGSLKEAITFAIQFEDKLAQLQAISGATGTEMQRLSANILEVSRNSANTVMEITESATILAQAGYSTQETQQLLKNVVNLSAASGSTPAEAVDIMTSALGAFKLQASDSTQVADALVAVLNESKLAVNQVQLGLQYLGATAAQNNINFETLVATLGAAADAGIRSGSTMATGTRQLLIDLQDPTKKLVGELERIGLTMADVDVKTQGLLPVLRRLKEQGFDAFGAVEVRAAAMYEVLSNNTDNIERLRDATLRNNVAAEAAAKRTDSLAAQWQIMKNKLAAVGSELGNAFIPLLKDAIQFLTTLGEAVGIFSEFMNGMFSKLNEGIRWFHDLIGVETQTIQSSHSLAKAVEDTTTAMNDSTAASTTQKEQLQSLEGEMGSIINRYDALAASNKDTEYEVARLAERFPGLRAEFESTKGGIEGLIGSLFKLRGEMRETLLQKTQLDIITGKASIQAQDQQLKGSIGAARRKYTYDPSQPESTLNNRMATILDKLTRVLPNPDGTISPDLAERDRGMQLLERLQGNPRIQGPVLTEFVRTMTKIVGEQATTTQTRNEVQGKINTRDALRYLTTINGGGFSNSTLRNTESTERLVSQTSSLGLSQRVAAVAPQIKQIEENLAGIVGNIELALRSGSKATDANVKELRIMERQERNNLRTLKGLGQRTEAELKEAEKNDRSPRGPGAGRSLTSAQMKAALEKQFPGIGISSGYRGPGHPLYDPGSWHSNVPGGRAIDVFRKPAGVTDDNIIAFMESLGQKINKGNRNSYGNENVRPRGQKNWTGAHSHFGWEPNTSRAESQAQRDLVQEQTEQANQEVKLAQADVAAKRRILTARQNSISDARTQVEITEATSGLERDITAYENAALVLAEKEIVKQKFDDKEAAAYRLDIRDRLKAERQESIRKSADAIAKAMDDFIKERTAAIEADYNRAMQSSRTNTARQEGLLQGMNNPGSQVPEYTKVIQQDRLNKAEALGRRDQYSANETKILAERQKLQELASRYTANADQESLAAGYEKYMEAVRNTTTEIERLQVEQANLIAQSEGISQVPQNWTEAMNQAVQAWRIQNNAGMSMGDRLRSGLGEAIDSVHGSFQTFFTDVMSGTVSVGKAFGNMAKAVVSALVEMAAKAVATQIFGLLLSFIPGAAGAGAGAGAAANPYAGFTGALTLGVHKGGLINQMGRVERYARGGLVDRGIPTRDTVPALLSKGEFVMRRSSVEDIGHRLVKDMNNRGSAALEGMGNTTPVINTAPKVDTNVYVVMPEEKPQLGPNDVLAIVSNDVLRNGATKQLIKQVSNGG